MMHRLNCGFLLLGLAAGAVALSGCTGASTLGTEPVEGVVTLDGEPVAGATVTFVPVNEGQGTPATGRTNEEGVYKLTAMPAGEVAAVPEAGTTPGEYYVGVRKAVVEEYVSAEEAEEQGAEYQPTAPGQNPETTFIVPKKYRNPRTSGLTVTVQEGQNNIPLELTSN